MSYDLQVIAKKQPRAVHLDAFGGIAGGTLAISGRFQVGGHLLLTDVDEVVVDVDGPSRIEGEDVPDQAAGAIRAAGWLVQLSVKPSTEAAWPMEIAIHLARAADGVVYDPQQDLVTWPKAFQPRDRQSGETRIEQVALDWYTAWPSDDPALPERVLQLFDADYPAAAPKRYGGFEPLPFRFEGERRVELFVERWLEEAASAAPMLFWSTTRPCFDGHASMTSRRPRSERPGEAVVHIGLRIDGRSLERDPAQTELVVALFRAMATGLACAYAGGSVDRGVIARGGRVSSDYLTEMSPMPRSDRWIGLPASPTWLAWFGKPYADLVRPSVEAHVTAEVDGGLLVRLGPAPMNADQLADRFPPLPTSLIAHKINQPASWIPRASYTLTDGPPSQPAEVVPRLSGD